MSQLPSEEIIWKYLDLANLLHLLVTQTLHFTRVDQFEDRFEGAYPHKNKVEWESQHPDLGNFKFYRKFGCASSWYQSNHESWLMWKQYGCIAIKSTKRRLKESFKSTGVLFNEIKYIDFTKDKVNINIPHHAFQYKSVEFTDEREYRAEIWQLPKNSGYINGYPVSGSPENKEGYPSSGKDVPVNLNILIERIVLSPFFEDWKQKCVADVLEKYEVSPSVLTVSTLKLHNPTYPNCETI